MSVTELLSMDENVVFNNINSKHFNNNVNYAPISEQERQLYEEQIKQLKEENVFLRQLLLQQQNNSQPQS